MPTLRLPMVERERSYRIRRVDPRDDGPHAAASSPLLDALRDEGLVIDGAWLAQAGLPIPPMKAEACAVLTVSAL